MSLRFNRGFNPRTGNMDEFILIDDTDSIPELSENSTYQTDDFQAPRSNSDAEINNYGRHLISICKSHGLYFLSGRFSGDSHGPTSCIENKGYTVVDYMIADSAFFEYVKKFSGMKRVESGHFPLAYVLETSIASHHELEDETISDLQPKKFKFDSSTAEDFAERVSDHVSEQKCKNIPMELSRATFKSSSLNSVICKISDLFLYWGGVTRNVFVGSRKISVIYRQPEWFDEYFRELKKQKFKLLTLSCETRNAYCYDNFKRARKAFKRLLRNKSRQHKKCRRLKLRRHMKTRNTSGHL